MMFPKYFVKIASNRLNWSVKIYKVVPSCLPSVTIIYLLARMVLTSESPGTGE